VREIDSPSPQTTRALNKKVVAQGDAEKEHKKVWHEDDQLFPFAIFVPSVAFYLESQRMCDLAECF